jgi:serine/threonine protein phosphatase PrpC
MLLTASGRTHVGLVRTVNEDAFAVLRRAAVVADGMGGHAAGEVASRIAVDTLTETLSQVPSIATPDHARAQLAKAFNVAARRCREFAADHPAARGMGTTVAACWIGSGVLVSAHMGDSRLYILRDGSHTVTLDHSVVMEMVAAGQLSREGARVHPRANVVTRCIGAWEEAAEMRPCIGHYVVTAGDRVVLVTDGATDPVAEGDFLRTARFPATAEEAAAAIEARALAAGAPDNITVVVIDLA